MPANQLESPTVPQRHARRNGPSAYVYVLISAFSFACMTACGHALSGKCDWRITAVIRAGLAFLFALFIAIHGRVHLVFWRPRTLWMRSLVGSVSMLLTFYAMNLLPVSTLLTLTNTFPLWVTLLAWPILGERPTPGFGIALLSGLLGVYLIEKPDGGSFRLETAAALGAALCTAIVMIGLHRLHTVDSLAVVVHFSGIATVVCLLFTLLTSKAESPLDLAVLRKPQVSLLLLGVGIFATLGQIAMTRAFRLGAPQRLSVVGLSQVVFALIIESIFWPHDLDARAIAGTGLILAPVAWLLARRWA